ncbi:MAG: hypothetical protein IJW81_12100, partial [Clostridia bacterium]|nr:hypothetical protein [Clostridia bacterium]
SASTDRTETTNPIFFRQKQSGNAVVCKYLIFINGYRKVSVFVFPVLPLPRKKKTPVSGSTHILHKITVTLDRTLSLQTTVKGHL